MYTSKWRNLFQSFTDEEKTYLDNIAECNAKVYIGLQHDAYPISFYNDADKDFASTL